jgi:hypothetical protein
MLNIRLVSRAALIPLTLLLLQGCQTTTQGFEPKQANTNTQSYQCANDIEIQCSASECRSESDGFTPMSVSFDTSGDLNVCAYSGCWQGQADVHTAGQFITLTGMNLPFSTSDQEQHIAITLDRSDNVAILKADSFAQPLFCKIIAN